MSTQQLKEMIGEENKPEESKVNEDRELNEQVIE